LWASLILGILAEECAGEGWPAEPSVQYCA
jgi:hypothetical protein